MALTPSQLERYARHIVLKEVGGPGQARLRAASVLIVGAGGLGAPAALYLAAAGVGRLGLVDHDAVSLSNLQRQVLFRTADVGRAKVAAAREALGGLTPDVVVDAHEARLEAGNARALVEGYDLVLDGTDDFATRFTVNDACYGAGRTLISAAVGRWDGQLSTFKAGLTKSSPREERLPCYRCLVPAAPPDAETCAMVGVVGALTGVLGAMAAMEAIKEIVGAGESLAGRLYLYDGLSADSRTVRLRADPACAVCGDG
ncbi:MAG: molybdopterin-synthase adenylyltransferase MoeB [Caulobacterales bacterium]|nr:molybdopterin-synthase adenylyltransferase MoeB [Caulobacterales bacterium]